MSQDSWKLKAVERELAHNPDHSQNPPVHRLLALVGHREVNVNEEGTRLPAKYVGDGSSIEKATE